MVKIQIGDIVVYANKRCMVVDTTGYPTKYVDLRWTISGDSGSRNEVSGHKRRVPIDQIQINN